MPQAVGAAAAAVANWVGGVLITAGGVGVVTTTTYAVITSAAYYATYAALTIGVSVGLFAAVTPNLPTPEQGAIPMKQARPPRQSGTGRARISGAYMLYEAVGNKSYDVFALHHGRIDGFERYFLHDDEVTLNVLGWVQDPGASQYSPNHVKIQTRLGLPSETAYSEPIAALPTGTWTSSHRGDGIASLYMHCNTGEEKYFKEDYPYGLPQPSVVARLSPVYDPRDPGQDPDDPDTWEWSENAVLNLLWYLCFADGGPQHDYETRVLPAIDFWIAAADICDEPVALKAGGTQPRYRQGGFWRHDNAPGDVIRQYLDCFDGWMSTRGDGAFVIYAGAYYEPEVTFTKPFVTGFSFQRFAEDEQAVNVLIVSYCSPDHKFAEVETDPWKDESDISARGEERSQPLSLPWVQYNGQARRLAKRKMARLGAGLRGTVRTNLYGLSGLGERYIRLQLDDVPALENIVVEIVSVEIDLANCALTFKWIIADPNIDSWNPATEEGDGPTLETRVAKEPLVPPTIDAVTPFFEANGTGGDGVRLRAELTGPDRSDLTWYLRWRVSGGVSWVEEERSDLDPEAAVVLESSFVTSDATIQVQGAYSTGSGQPSGWSATFEVSTSTEDVPPEAPTDLAGSSPAPGEVELEWRNPTSSNFDHARVYRGGATDAFVDAVDITGPIPGAAGAVFTLSDTGLATGTYRYWVVAENLADAASIPVGPEEVVVA